MQADRELRTQEKQAAACKQVRHNRKQAVTFNLKTTAIRLSSTSAITESRELIVHSNAARLRDFGSSHCSVPLPPGKHLEHVSAHQDYCPEPS